MQPCDVAVKYKRSVLAEHEGLLPLERTDAVADRLFSDLWLVANALCRVNGNLVSPGLATPNSLRGTVLSILVVMSVAKRLDPTMTTDATWVRYEDVLHSLDRDPIATTDAPGQVATSIGFATQLFRALRALAHELFPDDERHRALQGTPYMPMFAQLTTFKAAPFFGRVCP